MEDLDDQQDVNNRTDHTNQSMINAENQQMNKVYDNNNNRTKKFEADSCMILSNIQLEVNITAEDIDSKKKQRT
jgi:hypothetical protein